MQRLIVSPFEWGTNTGYSFLNNANPQSDIQNEAHLSWAPTENTSGRSFRIWEPGRMALSSMGVEDPDPDALLNVPQVPQGAKIHGIKGTMLIMPQRSAIFYNSTTGEQLDPQPAYDDIFAPDLFPYKTAGQPYYPINAAGNTYDPQMFAACPFYITMYKGSYQVYGSQYEEGGVIDSGPSDDPDTLIGIDITNPTTLEQPRIVWWDMQMCTAAHRSRVVRFTDPALAVPSYLYPEVYRTHVTRYNLSLDRNWIIGDDQVLWLHVEPGIVKTPIVDPTAAGNIMYRPLFNIELVASMLVTLHTPGV